MYTGQFKLERGGQFDRFFHLYIITTPPFKKSVRWYITNHIFETSLGQIETINKIEGNDARHVQVLYGYIISSQ